MEASTEIAASIALPLAAEVIRDIKDSRVVVANVIVLLYALFNSSFVIGAPLIGKLGDRIGRTHIVVLSYLICLVMSLGFAFGTTKWQIILPFVIYGVFYSIDEAQSKAFIADVEPKRRATAIGAYNFVTGVIYLPASLIAGALWTVHPDVVFLLAAFLSFMAINTFLFCSLYGNRNPAQTWTDIGQFFPLPDKSGSRKS